MRPERRWLMDQLDTEWRVYCIDRDEWRCRWCGTYPPSPEVHHIIKRRKLRTRWEPLNGVTVCRACHRLLESKPLYDEDFARETLGDDIYEALEALSARPAHYTDHDLRAMILAFKRGEPNRSLEDVTT